MSKYKVGDKMIVEITEVKENSYVLNRIGEVESMEAKIRKQTAEITGLLAENKELKERVEKANRTSLIGGRLAGQNEAWELARKIFDMETNDIEDIFIEEDAWNLGTVLNNYTYQEAAAKVAEWKRTKAKILVKAGDVLENIYDSNVKCIVTNLCPDNMAYLVFDDGTTGICDLNNLKKTGRHIDIDSFLKQIREEQE